MDRYKVLLVDDSMDDRFFMRKALEESSKLEVIGEARDGHEAIEYLKGTGAFQDRQSHPLPDLMLLDLKMPRKTGFDVLQDLKTESLKTFLVVVVSGAWLPEDVAKSLSLGADGYFKKSVLKEDLDNMVRELERLLEKSRA